MTDMWADIPDDPEWEEGYWEAVDAPETAYELIEEGE